MVDVEVTSLEIWKGQPACFIGEKYIYKPIAVRKAGNIKIIFLGWCFPFMG